MFAFNSCPILEKIPVKIECIDTWGSKLVVGSTEGVLLVYEVKEKEATDSGSMTSVSPFHVALADSHKEFAKKKPIVQLNVVESHKIVISLSDGLVNVHDLPSFNFRTSIPRSKGCTLYALDTSKAFLSLCVSVKKKLIIFNWDGNDFVEIKELAVPDVPKTIVWADQSLCIGFFKKEYNLINVQNGNMSKVFETGKSGAAIANLIPPDQLLLAKDNVSIFIGFDTKPTRRFGLSWTEIPVAIGYKFPYVLAALSRYVEVRMITGAQSLLQTLPIKASKEFPLKGITDKGDVYVASTSHVWRLVPVPLLNQMDQLIKDKEFEEAISLCDNANDRSFNKTEKLRQIKVLYAYHLFTQGQYERSMELLYELDVDPLQVIGLVPNLLPRDLRSRYTYPIEVPDLVGVPLEKAQQSLISYLTKKRSPYVAQLAAISSATSSSQPQPQPTTTPHDATDYAICTDIPTVIDTSLLKALIKTNEALLAPLVRSPNYCHIRECQKVLADHKKYQELVLLFKHKNLHREALELLQKLGQNPATMPLGGPSESIAYLKGLGKAHMPLILEFSRWILQISPEDALPIFTEERASGDRLPPEQILTLLKATKPHLIVPYLEHIIGDGRAQEKGAEFHNELIFQYLDTITALQRDPLYQEQKAGAANRVVVAGSEMGLLGATRKKLLRFLEESQFYHPEKMLSRFPSEDLFEERAILLSRIGQHQPALNIYAHKLKNFQMAEDYCARHYNSEKEEARDVYLSLLSVYLKPSDPQIKPMIQPAMSLLNKYYQRIDTPKALDLMPSNIPISQLYLFFENVLRDVTRNKRNNQVVKNLLKTENLQIREQLIKDRSKVIKIADDKFCPVCMKRLGMSVFACYPDGVVVHLMCINQQNQKKATIPTQL